VRGIYVEPAAAVHMVALGCAHDQGIKKTIKVEYLKFVSVSCIFRDSLPSLS